MPRRGFDLTVAMRRDLLSAYRQVYTNCHSQKEAWIKTARHDAPRFYVSPKTAYNVLRYMVRGDFTVVDAKSPREQRMYYELFRKLDKLSQQKEFIGKSLWFITPFLVSQPAPEFYASIETVRKAISCGKKYGEYYHHKEIFGKDKLSDKDLAHLRKSGGFHRPSR